MKALASVNHLEDMFTKGSMSELPDEIIVQDVRYQLLSSNTVSMAEMIEGKKPMVVYSLVKSPENVEAFKKLHTSADDEGHQDKLVFVWAMKNLRLSPAKVKFVSKARLSQTMVKEDSTKPENKQTIHKDKVIGDVVDIVIPNFNGGKALKGKVDTGATICSLHADAIEHRKDGGMSSDVVRFKSHGNTYKMTVQDIQSVQSADGGVEQRPVVKFTMKVNGLVLNDILVNLNDRSDMPHQLLLGQNFLEKGKFLIDPTVNEEEEIIDEDINWDMLQEMFKDLEVEQNTQLHSEEEIKEAVSKFVADDLLRKINESKYFSDDKRN